MLSSILLRLLSLKAIFLRFLLPFFFFLPLRGETSNKTFYREVLDRKAFNKGALNKEIFNKRILNKGALSKGVLNKGIFSKY